MNGLILIGRSSNKAIDIFLTIQPAGYIIFGDAMLQEYIVFTCQHFWAKIISYIAICMRTDYLAAGAKREFMFMRAEFKQAESFLLQSRPVMGFFLQNKKDILFRMVITDVTV